MADSKCTSCGARFDVPGAVGTLEQHRASFHPGGKKAAGKSAAVTVDVAGLDEVTQQLAEAAAALEGAQKRIAELEAENTELKTQLAAHEQTKPLDEMSKDELVQLAEASGLDASGTKPDLLERIKAAQGSQG